MIKLLINQIYLKVKLFGFKMQEDKILDDNLDEFNNIIIEFENIGVKIYDES